MKRLLTILFAFASLTAAAQYVPGQKNYGNYNIYGSQWLNGDLKLQKCIRSKSDTLIIFTTAAGVVDTVNWRYLSNIVSGANYFTLAASVLHPTDTTNAVAIGTNSAPAGTMLRVNDGSVLFYGSTGTTPASGEGTRMMWIPGKAAFRAGGVEVTQWDDSLVGSYSTAMGASTTASSTGSTAIGFETTASGVASTAMCYKATASGFASTAIGQETTASGDYSTAMGVRTTASGWVSTAMGQETTANSYALFTAGLFNDTTYSTSKDSWVSADPLFQVGNGTNDPSRNNAITILKNGTAYIGDASSTTDPILTVSTTDSTTTLIGILKLTPQDAPPVSASEGMIYADTDHHLYYYNGTAWVQLD